MGQLNTIEGLEIADKGLLQQAEKQADVSEIWAFR